MHYSLHIAGPSSVRWVCTCPPYIFQALLQLLIIFLLIFIFSSSFILPFILFPISFYSLYRPSRTCCYSLSLCSPLTPQFSFLYLFCFTFLLFISLTLTPIKPFCLFPFRTYSSWVRDKLIAWLVQSTQK